MAETTRTLLADLIEKSVFRGTVDAFGSTAERLAEEWAREVLKDPAVKAQMVLLARAAFDRALKELQTATPDQETR